MQLTKWIKGSIKKYALRRGVMAFNLLDAHWKSIVTEDLSRLCPSCSEDVERSLEKTLFTSLSFRSVLLFRIRKSGNKKAMKYFNRFLMFYPESPAIEIGGDIEGGLRIIHNSCVVYVSHAGKNLSVGPFAVVGKSHGSLPMIGNNVTICANSTVIGGINIGDNALIGASSFVKCDVAANSVVAGNPLKVLSTDRDLSDSTQLEEQ